MNQQNLEIFNRIKSWNQNQVQELQKFERQSSIPEVKEAAYEAIGKLKGGLELVREAFLAHEESTMKPNGRKQQVRQQQEEQYQEQQSYSTESYSTQ